MSKYRAVGNREEGVYNTLPQNRQSSRIPRSLAPDEQRLQRKRPPKFHGEYYLGGITPRCSE